MLSLSEYFTEDERSLTHELLNESPSEERIKTILELMFASRSRWLQEARPPIKTFFSYFPPLRNLYSSAVSLHLQIKTAQPLMLVSNGMR